MDLIAYKTMPQWGADDLPKAFLQHHNTKVGTWGHVQVLQGELMYYAMDEAGNILSETRLNPQNTPLFVEPQAWHKVAPLSEDMRMQLSFYCEKSDYFTKKYGMTAIHSAVKHMLDIVPPCTVLDLGCGQGRNALPLSLMGYRVRAADYQPAAVESIARLAAEMQLPLDTVVYDIHQADIAGEYDCIISTVVMMFLQADKIPAIIADMQAKTRHGGYNLIVCAMHSADYPCHMPFSFTFAEGELRRYYQDWQLHVYEEAPGKMHATDAQGNPIELTFVTMLAQKH